jgi:hypothetical protein
MPGPLIGHWRNQDADGAWRTRMDAAETLYGPFAGHWSQYFGAGSVPLGSSEIAAIADGKRLHVYWKPWSTNWAQVASGGRDTQLNAAAVSIASVAPANVWLSIHHEPENDVNNTAGSGFTYADYRAMWAQVRARFNANSVTNVTWVMTYMNSAAHPEHMIQLWPGDSLVDIVAQQTYIGKSGTPSLLPQKFINTCVYFQNNRDPAADPPRSWGYLDKLQAVTEWGADLGGTAADRGTNQHRADTIAAVKDQLAVLKDTYNIQELRYFDAGSNDIDAPPAADGLAFQELKDASEASGSAGPLAYVGSFGAGANSTSVSPVLPAGIPDGGAVFAVGICADTRTMSPPAGWTPRPGYPKLGGANSKWYLWKKNSVTAADSSSVQQFLTDATNKIIVVGAVFSSPTGFDLDFFDGEPVFQAHDVAGTTYTAPQDTSTVAGVWGVAVFGVRGTDPTNWTPAGGLTERQDIALTGSGGTALHLATSAATIGPAGTNFGAFNETNINTSSGGGLTLLVKPRVSANPSSVVEERALTKATKTSEAASIGTLAVSPVGQQIGDILVADFYTVGGTATHAAPDGTWTKEADSGLINSTAVKTVWTKEVTALGQTYTFDSGTTGRRGTLIVRAFHGVDLADRIDGTPSIVSGAGVQSVTHGSHTPGGPGRRWVLCSSKNTAAAAVNSEIATPGEGAASFPTLNYIEFGGPSSSGCTNSVVSVAGDNVTFDMGGAAASTPNGSSPAVAPGVFAFWNDVLGSFFKSDWTVNVSLVPGGGAGHFFSRQGNLEAAAGGAGSTWYAGMQTNQAGVNGLIFSVWEAIDSIAGDLPSTLAQPFSGEGEGQQVLAPFAWSQGRTYKFKIQSDLARGTGWVACYVKDMVTAIEIHLGSIKVAASDSPLLRGVAYQWVEPFFSAVPPVNTCPLLPRSTSVMTKPGYVSSSAFYETSDVSSAHTTNANGNSAMHHKSVGEGATGTQVVTNANDAVNRTWIGIGFLLKPAAVGVTGAAQDIGWI